MKDEILKWNSQNDTLKLCNSRSQIVRDEMKSWFTMYPRNAADGPFQPLMTTGTSRPRGRYFKTTLHVKNYVNTARVNWPFFRLFSNSKILTSISPRWQPHYLKQQSFLSTRSRTSNPLPLARRWTISPPWPSTEGPSIPSGRLLDFPGRLRVEPK